jgi:hypothetical protein
MLTKNWLSVIIIPIAIALILYFIILPSMENKNRTQIADRLVGTWRSTSENITIIFHQNKTFEANNNGSYYEGKWKITNIFWRTVNLNWEGFYAEYTTMFTNNNELNLVGIEEPAGSVYLYRK